MSAKLGAATRKATRKATHRTRTGGTRTEATRARIHDRNPVRPEWRGRLGSAGETRIGMGDSDREGRLGSSTEAKQPGGRRRRILVRIRLGHDSKRLGYDSEGLGFDSERLGFDSERLGFDSDTTRIRLGYDSDGCRAERPAGRGGIHRGRSPLKGRSPLNQGAVAS